MPLAEVCLGPLAPGAHEPVVQAGANEGTGQRDHPSRPLFHNFSAGPCRNSLDHPRHKFADDFFLQKLPADVHSRGSGGGNPKLGNFIIGIEFKTVNQAQLLDGSHGDRRENSQVGNNREHSTQAKPRSFHRRDFHATAHDGVGNRIQLTYIERVHPLIAANRQPICSPDL